MKKLYLLRHGEAPSLSGQQDFERALSKKGEQECLYLNKYFTNHEVPKLIWCSNSIRTRQTADIALRNLVNKTTFIIKSEIYNASVNNLLSMVEEIDDEINSLMVIGHNPSITLITEILNPVNKSIFPQAFDYQITAKLVVLNIDTNNWFCLTSSTISISELVIHKSY